MPGDSVFQYEGHEEPEGARNWHLFAIIVTSWDRWLPAGSSGVAGAPAVVARLGLATRRDGADRFPDWALSLDDSGLAPGAEWEVTVYLIPEFGNAEEAEEVLELVHEEVFERELESWHTEEADWSKDRSLAQFKRWFKIEMHSVVRDLCGDPPEEDGFD